MMQVPHIAQSAGPASTPRRVSSFTMFISLAWCVRFDLHDCKLYFLSKVDFLGKKQTYEKRTQKWIGCASREKKGLLSLMRWEPVGTMQRIATWAANIAARMPGLHQQEYTLQSIDIRWSHPP